ncbi:hypothetical protein BIV25_45050 [Streptomyces sp. MUSC 14]|nr:hypothetical protein BIV25_45050 [Streptomyces sp. MUSC 14]
MRSRGDPVSLQDRHRAVRGHDHHIPIAYSVLDHSRRARPDSQLIGSLASEGIGTFGTASRDHDLLDFSYRAHSPQLRPRLCARAHDAHTGTAGSGRGIDGDSTNGAGPPRAELRTMYQSQQLTVPSIPHSHQLLRTDKGVVHAEAEQLLLAQTPGGEDQMPVTEIGTHTRRSLHSAFIPGQDCRPYGLDSRPGIEPGTDIVVIEQQRRHK